MSRISWPSQTAYQIVQVGDWTAGDDQSVFPVGSKPKRLVICPDEPPFPFLIPGHRYLFKIASGWREQQLWSEVIAYEIAKTCGLWAPPCFAAFDRGANQSGVLMEFFYGYPGEAEPVRFVHGADILQGLDKDYDPKAGRPHSVSKNVFYSRAFGVLGARDWWAQTTAFDALIGNTDRHAENWGLLRSVAPKPSTPWALAPPFDHGTSLGYEVAEKNLEAQTDPANIKIYLQRGRHHCTWSPSTERRGQFLFTLCEEQCQASRRMLTVMDQIIPRDDTLIRKAVARWVDFDLPVKFTAARATFVSELIKARRNELVSRLGL